MIAYSHRNFRANLAASGGYLSLIRKQRDDVPRGCAGAEVSAFDSSAFGTGFSRAYRMWLLQA